MLIIKAKRKTVEKDIRKYTNQNKAIKIDIRQKKL